METNTPKRYALLGRRLGHSLSPRIHGLIFLFTALEGVYELTEVEPGGVAGYMESLRESGIAGLNVTIPYKRTVMPYLDSLSPEALEIGAVNTVVLGEGALAGYNTDYFGFSRMLAMAGIPVRGQKALILGTGGSARAVYCALRDGGAAGIALASRDPARAAGQFGDAPVIGYDGLAPAHGFDLLVNCTPVGMFPDVDGCPLSRDRIAGFRYVADLIYNPVETRLLAEARAAGARCVNGLFMLIAQAVRAQELWNSVTLEDGVIERIYRRMNKPPGENIVLIGMPGSGKTTLGRALAAALGRTFVDLDALIESEAGPIRSLFARGEDAFRQAETAAARRAARMRGAVIATGGGIVTRTANMRALVARGLLVYVNRPLALIHETIDYGARPLLAGGRAALETLYRRRAPLYTQYADITIDNAGSPGRAVETLLARIKEMGS